MFTERLIELARRKERLIARAEQQRAIIAQAYHRWQKPASLVDRGIAVVGFLRLHPLLLGVGLAAMIALRRRNLLSWAGRGWMMWRAWRSVNAWARKFGA